MKSKQSNEHHVGKQFCMEGCAALIERRSAGGAQEDSTAAIAVAAELGIKADGVGNKAPGLR